MALNERRIGDRNILRLIRKWMHVGVVEDGRLLVTETGTGQGQIISPLLANIYLHYVLDEWFEQDVKPRLRGTAAEIRYADDFILCFQCREDAERVLQVLPKRFAKFGLKANRRRFDAEGVVRADQRFVAQQAAEGLDTRGWPIGENGGTVRFRYSCRHCGACVDPPSSHD